MSYKRIIVTGPEGSGTTLISEIVSELVGWPWTTPPPAAIQDPTLLGDKMVYHISLPAYRPCVWMPVQDIGEDTLVIIVKRNHNDAIYSSWRRFHEELSGEGPGPDTLDDYSLRNFEATITCMKLWTNQLVNTYYIGYHTFTEMPYREIALLASWLEVPFRSHTDMGIVIRQGENNKYLEDEEFAQWVSSNQKT